MTVLEVLIAARSRIENRDHWTTGTWARDKRSRAVDPLSRRAVRWCAVGAVLAEVEGRTAWMLLTQAAIAHSDSMASLVNDGEGGHAAVLALYDAAIALARAEAES